MVMNSTIIRSWSDDERHGASGFFVTKSIVKLAIEKSYRHTVQEE